MTSLSPMNTSMDHRPPILRPTKSPRSARRVMSVLPCCWLLAFSPCHTSEAKAPAAEELLRNFAASQDQQRSFILKCEATVESTRSGRDAPFRLREVREVRTDGERCYVHTSESRGNDGLPNLPVWRLWDGRRMFTYSHSTRPEHDYLMIDRISPQRANLGAQAYDRGPSRGYLGQDQERVDAILRQATKIFVRPRPERMGNSDCWVVEGVTPRGKYTLWIDPQHGYHLAKAEVTRQPGDRDRDHWFPKDASEQAGVVNVRFEQIAGLWVPMESESTFQTRNPDGWLQSKARHRITEIILQPDHSARRSFALMPIRNGAKVVIEGAPKTPAGRWHDGGIVDGQGNRVDLVRLGYDPLPVPGRREANDPNGKPVDPERPSGAAPAKPSGDQRADGESRPEKSPEKPTVRELKAREAEARRLVLRGCQESETGDAQKAIATFQETAKLPGPDSRSPWKIAVYHNTACACGHLGRKEEAFGHLRTALSLGLSEVEHLQNDRDLEPLRNEDAFREIVSDLEPKSAEKQVQEVARGREEMRAQLKKGPLFRFDFDVEDVEGKRLALADLKGRIVLLDIWGTWCAPCVGAVPHLMRLQKEYGRKGLVVIGLAWERQGDGLRRVKGFIEKKGVNYRCAMVTSEILERIPDDGMFPTILLIDRSGRMRFRRGGYCEYGRLAGWIDALLEASSDAPLGDGGPETGRRPSGPLGGSSSGVSRLMGKPAPERQTGQAAPTRVLHFPDAGCPGTLSVHARAPDEVLYCLIREQLYPEAGWEVIGRARGDVTVPANKVLRLIIPTDAAADLSPLARLRPDDLQMLIVHCPFATRMNADETILPHVARLSGLQLLFLYNTDVTARGLKRLEALASLKQLRIAAASRSEPTPPHKEPDDAALTALGRLRSLQVLWVAGRFTDDGLRPLTNLTALREFYFHSPRVRGPGLAHLAMLPSLTYLDIRGNSAGDAGLRHLDGSHSLRKLVIAASGVTDAGLRQLRRLPNLEELDLSGNPITADGLAQLQGLPSLKTLNLHKTQVGPHAPARLKGISSLESVSGLTVDDEGLADLAELRQLKSLCLSGAMTDVGLRYLAKLQALEELELRANGITDGGVTQIAALTNLRHLRLHGCPITDRGLPTLATLRSLETLLLRVTKISASGLR